MNTIAKAVCCALLMFVMIGCGNAKLPSAASAAFMRAQEHEAAGKYRQAMGEYSQAIELDPELIGAYLYRGDLYRDRGSYALALADYKQFLALSSDPDNQWEIHSRIEDVEYRLNR